MKISVFAHGRVNLIGEHTDYNDGFVFPALIPQGTTIHGAPRSDDRVSLVSANFQGQRTYRLGEEKKSGDWCDYVQGATQLLRSRGFKIGGADLEISSELPMGSGLSSSAALLVATLRFFREAYRLSLEDRDLPRLAQSVENDFVGAHVGIMDPMAVALAVPGHALFVDTRSLATENVPLPEAAELLVINSGISHRNAGDGGYNTRRAQCESAARKLGLKALRDLSADGLKSAAAKLSEVEFQRARHVVTENARVLACVQAFKSGDLRRAGQLFFESHQSQKNDYQVSLPEIDTLVALAMDAPGVFGARLTGGGFGGSIFALCEKGRAAAGQRVCDRYHQIYDLNPRMLVPNI